MSCTIRGRHAGHQLACCSVGEGGRGRGKMRMQDRVDECTLTVCVYVGEPRDTVERGESTRERGESTREREQRGCGTCHREREREIVCALE